MKNFASMRDLRGRRASFRGVRREAARLGEENAAEPSLAARRAAVMIPAVASLDRLVRETLNLAGGGFVTPHARAFAKRHREGLLAAVDAFAAEPDVAGGWRVVKSEMARVARGVHRRRHLRLRDLSPALAGLKKRASAAWMPGCEPDEDVSDGSDDVLVVSVADAVAALPSKTRPKRVALVGDDGVERVFLLKGHEDLRLDERVMSTLRAANDAFASHDASRSRRLSARTYTVTPLAGRGGLIRWVERATPLSAMFSEWQRRARHAAALPPPDAPPDWRPSPPPVAATTRPLDLFYQRVSAALRDAGMSAAAPRRAWPASALRAANESLAAEIPRDLLRRELWCGAPTSAAWLRKVSAHARSVATASVLGHLLGSAIDLGLRPIFARATSPSITACGPRRHVPCPSACSVSPPSSSPRWVRSASRDRSDSPQAALAPRRRRRRRRLPRRPEAFAATLMEWTEEKARERNI